ncbi:copper resistance CopC family protein [Micromonospora sp. NBC_01813]|uniref:copper resistance CopC family protein n=1 Tax=Micromonospora sp. NBC_01813 TaxID=2975988 RepID=UPI002DDBC2F9|nr:copper resistance CopC family protein [Micromonospora sp. NBC_01813]WSA11265.1 copper resistance protein CopC [Micromonospora sp. NBC_01813]
MPRSDLLVRVTRGFAAALLAVAAIILPASPALAHNALASSQPGQNTRVAQSPEEIVLEFTERLNAEYTTIVITDVAGAQLPVDGPTVDQQRGVVRPVNPLPDGVYTVAYRVVSADGHPVQGAFRFAVNAPLTDAAAADPGAGQPTSDPDADGPADGASGGGGWWPYAVGGAVVLVAAGALAAVMLRRRRVT